MQNHQELQVYQIAINAAIRVFQETRKFPEEERRLLTLQLLRASRSVCANLAEAWQKRRYRAAFIAKLNEVEAEAAETQTWIELAVGCGYLKPTTGRELCQDYKEILTSLKDWIDHASDWVIPMDAK
jgi:four helix bundle protein